MLQTQTVSASTLALLKRLCQHPALKTFGLVGGTNFSLRYGHRMSVDLDFFSPEAFDGQEITDSLMSDLPDVMIMSIKEHMAFLMIQGVKIDLIYNPYPLVQPMEIIDDVRLFAPCDVIPLKLNAMARRGVKKDFRDIAELLKHYSVSEMMDFFIHKFHIQDIGYVIRAMGYFADADKEQQDPISLIGQTRPEIKQIITKEWEDYMRRELGDVQEM